MLEQMYKSGVVPRSIVCSHRLHLLDQHARFIGNLYFRCVPEVQRSFSLGIQWIVVRLIGMIPAPMVFGSLMDLSCIFWEDNCGIRGSCRSYDNKLMSRYFLIVVLVGKCVSVFAFSMAMCIYKPPPEIEDAHRKVSVSVISQQLEASNVSDDFVTSLSNSINNRWILIIPYWQFSSINNRKGEKQTFQHKIS